MTLSFGPTRGLLAQFALAHPAYRGRMAAFRSEI